MKKIIVTMLIVFSVASSMWAQDSIPWYVDRWKIHQPSPKAKEMAIVKVEGNHFVMPDGNTVLFRGIAISDPDKVARQDIGTKRILKK